MEIKTSILRKITIVIRISKTIYQIFSLFEEGDDQTSEVWERNGLQGNQLILVCWLYPSGSWIWDWKILNFSVGSLLLSLVEFLMSLLTVFSSYCY